MPSIQGRFTAAIHSSPNIDPNVIKRIRGEGGLGPEELASYPNARLEKVHIRDIRPGDTVLRDGITKTITPKDMGGDNFMGPSLFGDNYNSGTVPVVKVTFPPSSSKNLK